MNKKISVVIPCYNYANYLPECIDSLAHQTYPLHEVIIVNDGSPDETSEVARQLIEKYKGLNLKLVEKENGGLASARNAGIKEATGEYIMCLDADDKLVPAGVEEHVKLIEDEKTIAQCALMEFGERYLMMTPISPTSLQRILRSNTIYCNSMFSKEMWEKVGGYDESEIMRLGREDHEFWIRMLEAGCYVRGSNFVALRYRVHGNNMTKMTLHPNWAKIDEYFMEKHKDLYKKYNITLSVK